MAFKMRGHTLPGINKKAGDNMPDGRSKSAAFQYKAAYKLTEKQKALDVNNNNKLDADDFASLRSGESPNKKRGCKKKKGSSYKMLNKRNKSNKPCTGCKSICPSCRGKK
jgi:hypothetical protein